MLLKLLTAPSSAEPVKVFSSYAHKDRELQEKLEEHFAILKREGFIVSWHDRMIGEGEDWKDKID